MPRSSGKCSRCKNDNHDECYSLNCYCECNPNGNWERKNTKPINMINKKKIQRELKEKKNFEYFINTQLP